MANTLTKYLNETPETTGTPGINVGVSYPGKDGGSGGGGSAMEGLGQVDQGTATTRGAIGTAQGALGGNSGGSPPSSMPQYKKGGKVSSGGKSGHITTKMSTAVRNKSNSNW